MFLESIFLGMDTGKLDDNGRMIKCGDIVGFYQKKEARVVTTAQDGWGRTIPLGYSRQIPMCEKTMRGRVVYSAQFAGFIVELGAAKLGTFIMWEHLYAIGRSPSRENEKLVVLEDRELKDGKLPEEDKD